MSKKSEMIKAAEAAKFEDPTIVEGAAAADAGAAPAPAKDEPAKDAPPKDEPPKDDPPKDAPEMVLITRTEYDAVREVIEAQKGLGENLLKMQEIAKDLGEELAAAKGEIAGLRATVDALNAQLDSLVEKPVLVYVAEFRDGDRLVTEEESAIYATGKLPAKLIRAYAWKDKAGFELLDEDELDDLGLTNP